MVKRPPHDFTFKERPPRAVAPATSWWIEPKTREAFDAEVRSQLSRMNAVPGAGPKARQP